MNEQIEKLIFEAEHPCGSIVILETDTEADAIVLATHYSQFLGAPLKLYSVPYINMSTKEFGENERQFIDEILFDVSSEDVLGD
jgi:hypothetical protein